MKKNFYCYNCESETSPKLVSKLFTIEGNSQIRKFAVVSECCDDEIYLDRNYEIAYDYSYYIGECANHHEYYGKKLEKAKSKKTEKLHIPRKKEDI